MQPITRRGFLGGLLGTATLAATMQALPGGRFVTPAADIEMGNAWLVASFSCSQVNFLDFLLQQAIMPDMRRYLNPDMRYELRLGMPQDFGRFRHIGWYHSPTMALESAWPHERYEQPKWEPRYGFYLLERGIVRDVRA